MELNNLKPAVGSTKNKTRKGRGPGSGKGGTSTRGHKGAKSRSGYSRKIGFEGGQMPLQRRLPKFGFNSLNRVSYKAINLSEIEALAAKGVETITPEVLVENGLAAKGELVKILAKGALTHKVTVSANAFSAAAKAAIEAAGGEATELK
ncbi:MAG: 50S ribosomal protein L15 [Bacteroides sp.]|nr:50S ribosomal protein L15 [Bacteroides sp.]MCM1378524.1 50S ribosomal protein L15 [Bacteroides sp.]MCM1444825.1 50S ribosomal protein L15 [Prevotella sp.]